MNNFSQNENVTQLLHQFIGDHPEVIELMVDFNEKYPMMTGIIPDILKAYIKLVDGFEHGHTLFICGNGGSFADSMHLSSELLKSFERKRPLPKDTKALFNELPHGSELAERLEYGFPVVVLGLNHSLYTAMENDNQARYIGFAQELFALANKNDILIGISTSGNARNVVLATIAAKAKGLKTIALTGSDGGQLAETAELVIKAPAQITTSTQELHLPIYHTIAAMVEAHFFKERK